MPDVEDYVCGAGPPYSKLKAAAQNVSRGVRSGSLPTRGPPGSYYAKDGQVAIAAKTIAQQANYSIFPESHPLHEPESSGRGEGSTPRESARIGVYTAARSRAFHEFRQKWHDERDDLDEICRRELQRPPKSDEWEDVLDTLNEYEAAPFVDTSGSSEEQSSYETLLQGMEDEVWEANDIYRDSWGSTEAFTTGREVDFLAEKDGRRWGGRVDRVSIVTEDTRFAPRGVFATELKFTGQIRSDHIVQAEMYRHVFDGFELVDHPLDAAVVRIDIVDGECEVQTSLDEGWPEDAEDAFQSAYDRYYEKYEMVDTWLEQAAGGRM